MRDTSISPAIVVETDGSEPSITPQQVPTTRCRQEKKVSAAERALLWIGILAVTLLIFSIPGITIVHVFCGIGLFILTIIGVLRLLEVTFEKVGG